MVGQLFYIIDVRREWSGNPYITFWRPGNAGYCYPLPWAGKYSLADVEASPGYYQKRDDRDRRRWSRYAVPCDEVDKLGVEPRKGLIDGDVGPVVRNTHSTRRLLLRHRFRVGEPVE